MTGLSWQALRTRLVAGALCASVASIWIVTLVIGQYLRADMEAAISAQQYSTVSLIASEIELLARVGGNDFALGAASWNARRWLGHPGIEEGAPADIVIFADDPRVTISTVREPVLIILNGRVVGGAGD